MEKLKAFIALDLVIACHLLALTMQARSRPDEPADRWLAREEWEALSVQAAGGGAAPAHCPSIKDAVLMIAKLGGFLARKSDGDPGSEVNGANLRVVWDNIMLDLLRVGLIIAH